MMHVGDSWKGARLATHCEGGERSIGRCGSSLCDGGDLLCQRLLGLVGDGAVSQNGSGDEGGEPHLDC